jgi:hypothetical protein
MKTASLHLHLLGACDNEVFHSLLHTVFGQSITKKSGFLLRWCVDATAVLLVTSIIKFKGIIGHKLITVDLSFL